MKTPASLRPVPRRVQQSVFAMSMLALAGCDSDKPYLTTSGVGLHYTVVIDGVEVGEWREFKAPEGKSLDVGSSLSFRYQTPCGVRDVPMKVTRIVKEEHSRRVEAESADGQKPPTETLVLVDARGGASVDLQIGSAKIPHAESGHNPIEGDGAWYGRVLDIGCAQTHEVTLGAVKVGTLGQPGESRDSGKPGFARVVWISPKKDACFVATYPGVKSTRNGQWAGESGDWDDVLLRGPGWLPFDPDVFMKEPTDPKKPMAIVERPCPASP